LSDSASTSTSISISTSVSTTLSSLYSAFPSPGLGRPLLQLDTNCCLRESGSLSCSCTYIQSAFLFITVAFLSCTSFHSEFDSPQSLTDVAMSEVSVDDSPFALILKWFKDASSDEWSSIFVTVWLPYLGQDKMFLEHLVSAVSYLQVRPEWSRLTQQRDWLRKHCSRDQIWKKFDCERRSNRKVKKAKYCVLRESNPDQEFKHDIRLLSISFKSLSRLATYQSGFLIIQGVLDQMWIVWISTWIMNWWTMKH
jgi:hypothetical protein